MEPLSDHLKKGLLLGAGPMAVEHARVLKHLGLAFDVVGRGEASAKRFEEQTGIAVHTGGLNNYLEQNNAPHWAIVATPVEMLAGQTKALIQAGTRRVLVEKPAGLDAAEIQELAAWVDGKKAEVYVAFNRRFYPSVQYVRERIAREGLLSFQFEFTEWAHKIEPLQKAPGVKENWLLANSSHVIDTAFYLGGPPHHWKSFQTGTLSWHKPAAFSGAGITGTGALFSYGSDWRGPGRWGMDFITPERRYRLIPLEAVLVQQKGTVSWEPVELDNENGLKPGLFGMLQAFFQAHPGLPALQEWKQELSWMQQILGT